MVHTKLYDILGVDPKATPAVITRAFRIRALKTHPDKNRSDPDATDKFQLLQSSYDVLKDPKRRSRYDETGCLDNDSDDFMDMYEKFRSSFVEVTEEAIDDFAATYKGSQEEMDDIEGFYERFKGDLTLFFDFVPLSDPSECDRYLEIIRKLIDDESLAETRKFTLTCEKFRNIGESYIKKYKKESRSATSLKRDAKHRKKDEHDSTKKRKGGKENEPEEMGDMNSLILAIKGNQDRRRTKKESLFDDIIDEYGGAGKKKGQSRSKSIPEPPSEADFQAARSRLGEMKSASMKKKK